MSRQDAVGIVGAGAFGTALAHVVARAGRPVWLWSQNAQVVDAIATQRQNPRLPDVTLSPDVHVTRDPAELAASARLVVIAVASADVRTRVRALGEHLDGSHLLVHAIGALASPGEVRVSEVLLEETPALRVGALAGPALFRDLVGGTFASMVVASKFDEVTTEARRLLSVPPALRLYGGDDLIGVELAAALSGAYTVAVGMCDGLGMGPGPRAVLITRALAEASRLGEAAGADPRTFTGLAGLGNILVRTAASQVADYDWGLELCRGNTPELPSEGVRAARAMARLADRLRVRMPVLTGLVRVLDGELKPAQVAMAIADTVAHKELG